MWDIPRWFDRARPDRLKALQISFHSEFRAVCAQSDRTDERSKPC